MSDIMALNRGKEHKNNSSDLHKSQYGLARSKTCTQSKRKKPEMKSKLSVEELSEIRLKEDLNIFCEENSLSSKMTHTQFVEVLKNLKFIQSEDSHPKFLEEMALSDKAWKLISTENKVTTENLANFLSYIVNPYAGCDESSRPNKGIMSMGGFNNDTFTANLSESMRIHEYFWIFSVNRNIHQPIYTNNDDEYKTKNRNIQLYELSKNKKNHTGPTTQELRLQTSLSECTFRPKIIKPSHNICIKELVNRLHRPKNPSKSISRKNSVNKKQKNSDENAKVPASCASSLSNRNRKRSDDNLRGSPVSYVSPLQIAKELKKNIK